LAHHKLLALKNFALTALLHITLAPRSPTRNLTSVSPATRTPAMKSARAYSRRQNRDLTAMTD
jgi:hypothetical protein